jgi:UDP-glucuronate 4-epimerase
LNILITGGAGFIGSHLAARLAARHRVTVVDMLHPYYSPDRKRAQLESARQAGSFRFYQGNLLEESSCQELFRTGSFDAVYHLAAVPGVTASITEPHMYIDHNLKATVNVLRWAGESGVKHVLFASSSSVYGDREGIALTEEMSKGEVISPYAATKVGGEALCHTYQYLYGYRMTMLRFFTVYGTWGRPDMAIALFIRKLMRGEPITVFGEHSARDYTYISDICAGLEGAMELNTQELTGVYNLGAGNPVLIEDLLGALGEHFPQMQVERKPWRTGDVRMTWADTTRAREAFGYRPEISIREGLNRTIAWAKANPNFV